MTNVGKAKAFYGKLFEWVAYVSVDDLKAATTKAKSLGTTVIKDQIEIKGGGSFSLITDPKKT